MKLMEWNIHGMGGYDNYSLPVHTIMDTFEFSQIVIKK